MKNLLLTLMFVTGMSTAIAQTTTTRSHNYDFPLIGLGSTETAEVDVINPATNSSSGTAASCTGTVSFLNSAGTTIGSATPFTLTAGQASPVKLPFSSSGGTAPRTLIRAVVSETVSTSGSNPPCGLQFTMSIYDTTTGATHAVLTGGGLASGPFGR
ncbi:MAG: hypothetical protein JO022_10790 [Acidobacteriaceae bacterium]|nr:hypothetical protein [Acidobacteriaceae bacterium]